MSSEYTLSLTYNLKPGHCLYCCTYLKPRLGIILQQCQHLFCRQCLQFAIQIRKQLLKIPCPVAGSRECRGYLLDSEVRELVSPNQFQEYIDRSLEIAKKKMRNVFYCKSDGCSGWCVFDQGRKTFICALCNETNCMECNCIHSFGDTCDKSVSSSSLAANGWEQILEIMKNSKENWQPESSDLILNRLVFECPICFIDVKPGKGVILHECLHMFCFQCLNDLIEHNDESAMVKCPYIDGNYSCMSYLQPREIRRLVPDNIYEKHLQRSIKLGEVSGIFGKNESSFHCKTPDCLGWCVFEEGAVTFQCQVCRRSNCIRCKVIHEGLSCEEYKNRREQNENDKLSEETLERLIAMGEAMRCPKCRIPVQKIQGCDWMKCSVCQTEICWATRGPRWGPKGRGDTSGGCKCMSRKRCHPKCKGCH